LIKVGIKEVLKHKTMMPSTRQWGALVIGLMNKYTNTDII
jgi:hypothetical protein